jgi:hypothetical protein
VPSIATPLTTTPGQTVVLVAPAPPRIGAARRGLGVAIAAYVALLCVLAALATIPTGYRLPWPGAPVLVWWGPGDATAVASAVVRAFPIGFTLAFGRRRRDWLTRRTVIALAGAAVVAAAELARWLTRMPVRPLHVLVGAAAAIAGGTWYEHAFARRRGDHALGSVVERVLPLELPLTGAVMLLVPPIWLVAQDPQRLPVVTLLGCFGASLLTSARVSRGPAAGGAWTHAVVAAAWIAVATLPAWLARPFDAAALATGVALFAAAHALLRPPDATDRRFEGPALRRALPLLLVYLFVAAAWPVTGLFAIPDSFVPAWGWGPLGARGALEQVTVFVVVGYTLAELRGRREERASAAWSALAPWLLSGAVVLELVRTLHPGGYASVARAASAAVAAWLGVAIYVRHRDHVRAWRAAGGRVSGVAARVGLRDPDARAAGGRRRR